MALLHLFCRRGFGAKCRIFKTLQNDIGHFSFSSCSAHGFWTCKHQSCPNVTMFHLHSRTQYMLPTVRIEDLHRNISFWGSSKLAEWNKAVSEAEKIVGYTTSYLSLRCLLSDELSNVAMQMRKLVGTKHPLLKTARKLFADDKHNMQTRGLLVLLISKAAGSGPTLDCDIGEVMVSGIYPRQRNLAEIIEMIHTANLIHKGVVNVTGSEVNGASVKDMQFGNNMAVLSGDFLLASASKGLADLNNTHVVEIVSSAIGDMMEAEFSPLRDELGNPVLPSTSVSMSDWHRQTYLASGCLIAKSCKAAMILANHSVELQQAAYEFGLNIAYAHQLNEDLQPFVNSSEEVQITSAPVILHLIKNRNYPQVLELMQNPSIKHKRILKILHKSPAIEEARTLCKEYGEKSLKHLSNFPDSEAKTVLKNIVKAVTAV